MPNHSNVSRRTFLKNVGLVSLGAALAACTTVATPNNSAESGSGASSEPQTVTVWGWWDVRMQLYADSANNYMENHPDVEITVESLPYGDLWAKIYASVAANTGPTLLKQIFDQYFKMLDQDLMLPYPVEIFPNAWLQEKYPTMNWDAYQRYIMPTGDMASLLIYNKTMFEEVGLDVESPPQTWDELVEMSTALTIREDNGRITRAGYIPGFEYMILDFLYQLGGNVVSREGDTITPTFDTSQMVRAYQFVTGLATEHHVWDREFLTAGEAIGTSNAAMITSESYIVGELRSTYPDVYANLGYAALPTPTGSPEPYYGRKATVLDFSIMTGRPPEEVEAVYGYLEYLYTEDLETLYRAIELTALARPRSELFTDPRVLESPAITTLLPVLPDTYDPVQAPAELEKIINDVTDRILLTNESVESAVQYGQEQWEAITGTDLVNHIQ